MREITSATERVYLFVVIAFCICWGVIFINQIRCLYGNICYQN
jgi:hypothetical protein